MNGTKITMLIGLIAIVAGAFLIFGGGIGERTSDPSSVSGTSTEKRESTRDRVPDVDVVNASGDTVALSSFEGKPLIINSWATWCPFCIDELPDFALLENEFEGQVTVLAVNRRESVKKAESFLSSINLSTDSLTFLYDRRDNFYRKIGGFSMPETLFVNAKGEIVVHKRGIMDIEEMRENTLKILNR